MATAVLLNGIAKDRVNAKNPPSPGNDIDPDRCAALHNTLLLYGWVCSGKKINQLEKRSWWGKHGNDTLSKILRPKLVRFLSKVFDVPNGHHLFYHVSGLATQKEMLQLADVLEDSEHENLTSKEKHRFVVLYHTSSALVTQPAGIVYDQQTGLALLMPTYHQLFDFNSAHLPWQKLETILSAYVDMIEVEKAVPINDEIGKDGPEVNAAKSDLEINKTFVRYRTRPWLLQPYTLSDLHACIDAWSLLVETLEKKAGLPPRCNDPDDPGYDPEDDSPIVSRTALKIAGIPRGFAFELLSHLQQSSVTFIAPGLRLPKVEEFLQQPFKHILQQYPEETKGMKMPFLFLRCPGTVTAKQAKFRHPFSTVENVPCGLYLDAFPNAQNPFEDTCRLVLPIRLGDRRYARTSDHRPIIKSHTDLYQTGINPFVMRHGPKLVAVLENWISHIQSGYWTVNSKGVEGGIGVWREADTRDNWWRYQTEHLVI